MLDGETSLNVRQLSGSEHVRNDALVAWEEGEASHMPLLRGLGFLKTGSCILPGRKARLLRQVKVVKVFGLVKC